MPSVPLMAIVDDDDALRNSLDNLLRSVGFRVQGFASAEAFLQAQHAPETACLILDVRLPGMNGLSCGAWISGRSSHAPERNRPTPVPCARANLIVRSHILYRPRANTASRLW